MPHECYHILRLAQVPEDERALPGSSFANYETFLEDCLQQPGPWMIPISRQPSAMEMLYQGLIIQATSEPADIRIERELAQQYPDLHKAQANSLRDQIEELYPLTELHLKLVSPPKAYAATLHMGTAYAKAVGDILGDAELAGPLEQHADPETVAQLLAAVDNVSAPGYAGDREAIDAWTSILGLQGWYQWVPWEACR